MYIAAYINLLLDGNVISGLYKDIMPCPDLPHSAYKGSRYAMFSIITKNTHDYYMEIRVCIKSPTS